jgi:guanine deaminase
MQGNPEFMRQAIALATENVTSARGGPFGAVIVREEKVIATGVNRVTSTNDPTAHAEVMAIRAAGAALSNFRLSGCEIYTSCEPCPMCLSAIYWSHLDAIYYANSSANAAAAGFADAFLYEELKRPIGGRRIPAVRMPLGEEALESFEIWLQSGIRVDY